MSKFFVLYLAPVASIEKMMANSSKEDMQKGMDSWMGWMNNHKSDLADMGAPLGKTKRVTASGVTNVKNEVTGYSIVEAESHDAAAKMMEGHPHLQMPDAYIDIVAVMPIPGM